MTSRHGTGRGEGGAEVFGVCGGTRKMTCHRTGRSEGGMSVDVGCGGLSENDMTQNRKSEGGVSCCSWGCVGGTRKVTSRYKDDDEAREGVGMVFRGGRGCGGEFAISL